MYFPNSVACIYLNSKHVFLWFFDRPFPRIAWSVCCWWGGPLFCLLQPTTARESHLIFRFAAIFSLFPSLLLGFYFHFLDLICFNFDFSFTASFCNICSQPTTAQVFFVSHLRVNVKRVNKWKKWKYISSGWSFNILPFSWFSTRDKICHQETSIPWEPQPPSVSFLFCVWRKESRSKAGSASWVLLLSCQVSFYWSAFSGPVILSDKLGLLSAFNFTSLFPSCPLCLWFNDLCDITNNFRSSVPTVSEKQSDQAKWPSGQVEVTLLKKDEPSANLFHPGNTRSPQRGELI